MSSFRTSTPPLYPPTVADQRAALSRTWNWVPYMECSLLHTATPSFTYLITSINWDGFAKTFTLQPLTDRYGGVVHGVTENELFAPREEDFTFSNPDPPSYHPYHHQYHTPMLPVPPPSNARLPGGSGSSTGGLRIGLRGRALGIGLGSVQAPVYDNPLYYSKGMPEFSYSQRGGSPPPTRRFGSERYGSNYGPPGKYGGDGSSSDEKFPRGNGSRSVKRHHGRDGGGGGGGGGGGRKPEGRDGGERGRGRERDAKRNADVKKQPGRADKGEARDEEGGKKQNRASPSPKRSEKG